MLISSPNKRPKQRMRLQRLRLELRMKLAPDKMWMLRNLDHFNVSPIRSRSRNPQPASNHRVFVFAIELVTMPMALADFSLAIDLVSQCASLNFARPSAETHRPTQFLNAAQLAQLVNHSMWSSLIKLAGISIRQPANVAREFNTS